jgi:sugar phosphate isomerase/epimerase
MKLSMCQYSFVRLIEGENWDIPKFVTECAALGLPACDFHQRLVGTPDAAKARVILSALKENGLAISGFSLSNNFGLENPEAHRQQLAKAVQGMEFGADLGAKIIRFFGCEDNPRVWRECMDKCLPVAEKHGLIIALENHGGFSSSASAQLRDIEAFNSPHLKALIDIGNYLQVGEDPVSSIRKVRKHCAYVHLKDFSIFPQGSDQGVFRPRAGHNLRGETIGEGDLDLAGCLAALREGGYGGYAAVEFEGQGDVREGIEASLRNIRALM